ncbi:MAG: DinB family protein [Acidimicrobiia bacterium]|nr:DinB family protein [Acidimicrobiia bacterium]
MSERDDFIGALNKQRDFLRFTVKGLTDEQAGQRTTVSELCLGGLVKHVAAVEAQWVRFIEKGPSVMVMDTSTYEEHAATFRMDPGDSLESILQSYGEVATHTDELVRTIPSLDADHPLPEAPWFEPGARWSARRVLLHIVAESAQHCGHADIIREALDGQKTMG